MAEISHLQTPYFDANDDNVTRQGKFMTNVGIDLQPAITQWLQIATEGAPGMWIKSKHLFVSWDRWALAQYGISCSRKAFTQALRRHGFEAGRLSDGAIIKGLRLKPAPKDQKKAARLPPPPNPVIDALLAQLVETTK